MAAIPVPVRDVPRLRLLATFGGILWCVTAQASAQCWTPSVLVRQAQREWNRQPASAIPLEVHEQFYHTLADALSLGGKFGEALQTARRIPTAETRDDALENVVRRMAESYQNWNRAISAANEIKEESGRESALEAIFRAARDADRIDITWKLVAERAISDYEISRLAVFLAESGREQDARKFMKQLRDDNDKVAVLIALAGITAKPNLSPWYHQAREIVVRKPEKYSAIDLLFFQVDHGLEADMFETLASLPADVRMEALQAATERLNPRSRSPTELRTHTSVRGRVSRSPGAALSSGAFP